MRYGRAHRHKDNNNMGRPRGNDIIIIILLCGTVETKYKYNAQRGTGAREPTEN